jgi:predicted Abi (CAAX) family protease
LTVYARIPDGVVNVADFGTHGADVQFDWAQTRELSDVLTRLLEEANVD